MLSEKIRRIQILGNRIDFFCLLGQVCRPFTFFLSDYKSVGISFSELSPEYCGGIVYRLN